MTSTDEGCRALWVEGASISRRRGGFVFDLDVPSLHVAQGEFVAIVGESGCGKSTLLDLLALVTRPVACKRFELTTTTGLKDVLPALLSADDRTLAAIRAVNMGYVLQRGGLLPFLSVRDNVALSCHVAGKPVDAEEIESLLTTLGIADRKGFKPKDLSGGQRQRAAIARALSHFPGIILADEPTAAVDETRGRAIIGELHDRARDRGAAVLVVTHHREMVSKHADRLYGFELSSTSDDHLRSTCKPIAN